MKTRTVKIRRYKRLQPAKRYAKFSAELGAREADGGF